MTREPVKSSHIRAMHRDLMESDSPGKMMHARVRGAYKNEKIGERR